MWHEKFAEMYRDGLSCASIAYLAGCSEQTAWRHLRKAGVKMRGKAPNHSHGDKADNRPENLQLRQGKHGKHVVMCCLDCGSRNIGHAHLEEH